MVERYFAELSLWTLADLKLFANISCVLPFELMENLLAEALKAKRRYRNYPQSNTLFATLLINCLEQTFAKDRPELSQSLLEQLSEFTAEAEEIGYRLFERYYQALYEYRYGELKKGKEELLAVQKVARFLDAKLVLEKSEEALK